MPKRPHVSGAAADPRTRTARLHTSSAARQVTSFLNASVRKELQVASFPYIAQPSPELYAGPEAGGRHGGGVYRQALIGFLAVRRRQRPYRFPRHGRSKQETISAMSPIPLSRRSFLALSATLPPPPRARIDHDSHWS